MDNTTYIRLLCFSPVAPAYISETRNYNGGGWIDGFISLFRDIPDIALNICFFTSDSGAQTQTIDGVSYYPVYSHLASRWGKLKAKFFVRDETSEDIEALKQVIDRVKPDIVQFFGSEWQAIRILDSCRPAVVHIQGIVSAYMHVYLPPAVSKRQLFESALLHTPLKLLKRGSLIDGMAIFRQKYFREQDMLPCLTHVFGRTAWDRDIIRLFAPHANYYNVGEILREPFYRAPKWAVDSCSEKAEIHICSTISDAPYKGLDLIFKTAQVFDSLTDKKIIWHIYGINRTAETYFLFRHLHKSSRVRLVFEGVVSAEELISGLLSCAVYVHPGYIDNSSNSICEAQYVGIPVVATHVGGTPSLIENGKTGLLVAANDPYSTAAAVLKMLDSEQAVKISANEIAAAESRHDKESIKSALIAAYKEIYKSELE